MTAKLTPLGWLCLAVMLVGLVGGSFLSGMNYGALQKNSSVTNVYQTSDQTIQCTACSDCKACKDLQKYVDRLSLYDKVHNISAPVSGLWYNDSQAMVVWYKDRTESAVNRSVVHEECHRMVDSDPQHFCGKWISDLKNDEFGLSGCCYKTHCPQSKDNPSECYCMYDDDCVTKISLEEYWNKEMG